MWGQDNGVCVARSSVKASNGCGDPATFEWTRCQLSNATLEARGENFVGSSIAEAFSRTVVEKLLHLAELMLRKTGQVRALGEELADQAVGVLVPAALPRTVRLGEVDLQCGFHLQLLMFGKLLAVVQGEGFSQGRGRRRVSFCGGLADRRRLQVGDLAQQQVARLPLEQRGRLAAAIGADDRVSLSVAETPAASVSCRFSWAMPA
jgi:hypothetical protein